MREIKFRAWEPLNEEMHYMNFCLWEGKNERKRFALPEDNQSLNGAYASMNLNSLDLMQFTGLKDKNEVEIYEGDILHRKGETVFLVTGRGTGEISINLSRVVWVDDSWGYEVIKNIQNYPGVVPHTSRGLKIHAESGEVIGNIYENPELLEKN